MRPVILLNTYQSVFKVIFLERANQNQSKRNLGMLILLHPGKYLPNDLND